MNETAAMQSLFATETYGGLTTTFTGDLSIAERFGGAGALADTLNRALASWKGDIRYLTNLFMVVSAKSWAAYAAGETALAEVYADAHDRIYDYVYNDESPFTKDEINYFFRITD